MSFVSNLKLGYCLTPLKIACYFMYLNYYVFEQRLHTILHRSLHGSSLGLHRGGKAGQQQNDY